jgi:hypothetical protein
MGSMGGGGLDQEFEDSLDDFDAAVAGGDAGGGGGGEEEIDILDPMGGGGGGAPTDEPLFEEGGLGESGDMAEDQSIAQRAESGSPDGSSSSGGGQQGGGQQGGGSSGEQSASQQSEGQSSMGGGGGASAPQGEQVAGRVSAGAAEEGADDIIPIPQDVGDGRNDDIVLRQIREAAMNERDPVLREKLWDEYRRIKASR